MDKNVTKNPIHITHIASKKENTAGYFGVLNEDLLCISNQFTLFETTLILMLHIQSPIAELGSFLVWVQEKSNITRFEKIGILRPSYKNKLKALKKSVKYSQIG